MWSLPLPVVWWITSKTHTALIYQQLRCGYDDDVVVVVVVVVVGVFVVVVAAAAVVVVVVANASGDPHSLGSDHGRS